MSASLDEERVQEQEACSDECQGWRNTKIHECNFQKYKRMKGHQGEFKVKHEEIKNVTFECEPIVLNTICHVPPHNVLYILQGLRCQWCIEACSLQIKHRWYPDPEKALSPEHWYSAVLGFTWKKLSSLSLRTPSLSKSDTLKILVKDLTQDGFNWEHTQWSWWWKLGSGLDVEFSL